ncbi:MAG: 4Fe-4S dicluster domain-containing protein [Candidatus Omnitrophota bacterium]
MKVEEKLFKTKFKADAHEHCHLKIKDREICLKCDTKPCTAFCPAQVYTWEKDKIIVGYENCLECGSCRIACPYYNIEWRYPRGGFGVQYRMG